MKRMSSELTLLYRAVYPIFFGGMTVLFFLLCLSGALRDRSGQSTPWFVKWIVLAVGGGGTFWLTAFGRSIQEVEMDEKKIRVVGQLGTEEIPLTSIRMVEETILQNPKLLILHVSPKSRYGETIRFIPIGMRGLWNEHPLMAEIENACKEASRKTVDAGEM